jgi:hypothetical protein
LSFYWNTTTTNLLIQKDWTNYYPTVSSKDFADGYFDTMEEFQGEDNVFYVGRQFSCELTSATYAFAKELIERKFEAVMAGSATTPVGDGGGETSSAWTPWVTQVTTPPAILLGGSLAALLAFGV